MKKQNLFYLFVAAMVITVVFSACKKDKIIDVSGVSLSQTTLTLTVGSSETLTATVFPADAHNKEITWSSSASNLVSVNNNGLVTAIGEGTAIITVTTANGGKTAICTVTVVSVDVMDINFPSLSGLFAVGNTRQLTVIFTPDNATNKTITWSSSNEAVATVSNTGLVTAKTLGTAAITATTADGNKTANFSVTVKDISELTDGEWLTFQSHTVGNGIDLVFMGDGYTTTDIAKGKYEADMRTAIEGFFDIQPYKAYRKYFNVYIVIAESAESGIGIGAPIKTKFSTTVVYESLGSSLINLRLTCNMNECYTYAQKAPIENIENYVVVLIAHRPTTYITINGRNYNVNHGICYMGNRAIAINHATTDNLGYLVQHEAGGHGFGKLADEYFTSGTTATQSQQDELRHAHSIGYYANVDNKNDLTKIIWKDFIGNPKYNMVDAFEGAYYCEKGFWRSEEISTMGPLNVRYFNAPSRAAIVKRIKTLAGEPFTMEWFMATDIIEPPVRTRTTDETDIFMHTPPIWVND
jgi:hypothetical protein